ncbi:apovitellenin-1-like isoform 2-T2 [Discoglossus pictus]
MYRMSLILLLLKCAVCAKTDVHAKGISKRHVQPDWLTIPDAIVTGFYETVNSLSPKAGEVLVTLSREPLFQEARNLLIMTTQTMIDVIYDVCKNIREFWEIEDQQQQK